MREVVVDSHNVGVAVVVVGPFAFSTLFKIFIVCTYTAEAKKRQKNNALWKFYRPQIPALQATINRNGKKNDNQKPKTGYRVELWPAKR